MTRIKKVFEKNREEERKTLISYITAGYPSLDASCDYVLAMKEAGVDMVELGLAYSDPLADGPVIQNASARALEKGVNTDKVFKLVEKIRKLSEIPLILLVYYNSIYSYGIDSFISKAEKSGLDGLIIPDLPLEERASLQEKMKVLGLDLIPLVAPTSKERIGKIVDNSSGFIYCVSSTGVTGVRSGFDKNIKNFLADVREETDLPLAIGFGISGPEAARDLSKISDGVIVGSALIRKIDEGMEDGSSLEKLYKFSKDLRIGIDQ